MPLTQLAPPYPIFTDKNGDPLDAGYLYFGVVNLNPETNPIQVYYDSALTQPAAQPLRTSNGYVMRNGSPALLFAGSQFSVTVRNKNSELVIYSPVGYGILPGTSATSTDQITYNEGSTGAVDRVLTSRLQDRVSVKDFGAVGDGVTDDLAAIQAALDSGAGGIYFPSGTYLVSEAVILTSGVHLHGDGYASLIKSTGTNRDVFYGGTVSNVSFQNLRIEGNQTGLGSNTAGFGGDGVNINAGNNIWVTGCYFDYLGVLPQGTSSYACGVSIRGERVRVTNCYFGENSYCVTGADIGVGTTTDTIVANNISHSEMDAFVSISAVSNAAGTNVVRHTITGNLAKRKLGTHCRSAVLAVYDAQPGYVAITGNEIEGFIWNGIYISAAGAPTTTQDGGGVSIAGNTIRYCGGSGTITAGIYVSGEAGATVSGNFLRDIGFNSDGTMRTDRVTAIKVLQYSKNVAVTGNTIVNCNDIGIGFSSLGGGIENCTAIGNTVRSAGLLLASETAGIAVASDIVGVQCRNIIIQGNTVYNTVDIIGIFVGRANNGTSENIFVNDNIVEGTAAAPTKDGIRFDSFDDGGSIRGNRVIGFYTGISAQASTDRTVPAKMRVEANYIKNCAYGFAGGNKVSIEFGNTYENIATATHGFRAYPGRPIGEDGNGNLLVEYIDNISGPFQGPWYQGDRLVIDTPTIDGNNMVRIGKICVASGTTGTWANQYISTVTPAT